MVVGLLSLVIGLWSCCLFLRSQLVISLMRHEASSVSPFIIDLLVFVGLLPFLPFTHQVITLEIEICKDFTDFDLQPHRRPMHWSEEMPDLHCWELQKICYILAHGDDNGFLDHMKPKVESYLLAGFPKPPQLRLKMAEAAVLDSGPEPRLLQKICVLYCF